MSWELTRAHRQTAQWRDGSANAAQPTFGAELQRWVDRANANAADASDATKNSAQLASELDAVNAIMHSNIELLMARQERLEAFGRRTEELSTLSKAFYTQSRNVKRFQMWQEAKWGLALGAAATAGALVIALPVLL